MKESGENMTRISKLDRDLKHISEESNKKIEQFTSLTELSGVLNSTLDQDEVRKRAMVAATKLMNCEVSSLLLLDDDTNELYFEVALGDKGAQVKEMRLKVGEGIAGWVAEHGKSQLIRDISEDPRHFKEADERTDFVTRDMLCVPLKVKDKTIGVLEAINKIDGEVFNDEDLGLFQLLANQVAIAVDNARLYTDIHETFLQTANALAEAIEKRDPYTGGHTKRVVKYSKAIAQYLDMEPADKENLEISAILHDIGKIGIEDIILRKPSKLNEEEFLEMKKHPVLGHEIINNVSQLRDVVPGIRYHHERLDGTGYPDGLFGDGIPLIARIISVADAFDAMTTDRPYRKALDMNTAIKELETWSSTQFDEDVVNAFVKAYHDDDFKSS